MLGNLKNGLFLSNFWSSKVYFIKLRTSRHCSIIHSTDWADARVWTSVSYCCATGTISYELDLVFKNYQRVEEDVGEEAVKILLSDVILENWYTGQWCVVKDVTEQKQLKVFGSPVDSNLYKDVHSAFFLLLMYIY